MAPRDSIVFADFCVDTANECVRRGAEVVALPPKAFAVLRYLVEHRGRLVPKEELLQAVWSETVVGEAALTVCIGAIRRALGDEAQRPRFIETVHRRGYRFIAPVTTSPAPAQSARVTVHHRAPPPTPTLVGRDTELAELHARLDQALSGERQLVFITGEPGIGKTTVVEAFLNQLTADGQLWIGRGQCIEHYGPGEAYLPVLEALGRLCRAPGGERFVALLSQHAPTWVVQMPTVLSMGELEALQRTTHGATRERMLRELAEALERVTAEQPLVLWLEDLQWSDVSTLDWLAFVARRPEPCRLLVLGTYRPVEVIVQAHPLRPVKQELQMHGQCVELALGLLTQEHVSAYLETRCPLWAPGPAPRPRLAPLIHQRTDGNPLFMVTLVEYLIAQRVLVGVDGQWAMRGNVEEVREGMPESLRQMIARQIEQLGTEERRLLEVASVVGREFPVAAVAAGLETEVGAVEERCAALVQRGQFLRSTGTAAWPDGTVAARYSFLHALYPEVLYEGVTTHRRSRLHQQIGAREEHAYGARAREIAAQLAVHFEQGRDYPRAVRYLQQAGENASRRSATHEAITLLTKGLELLKALPDTPERARQELTLQLALGGPLIATKGKLTRLRPPHPPTQEEKPAVLQHRSSSS